MPTDPQKLSLARTLGAREVIRPHLRPTPLRQYPSLNRHIGAQVYDFKTRSLEHHTYQVLANVV